MPGEVKKQPEIAGAICAPPQPSTQQQNNGNSSVSQPRQPTSLRGLLNFAMQATESEDTPHDSQSLPLDEERKKYLEEALRSMTIDVIEVLLKQIKILEKVETLTSEDDITEYTTALETISDYVCDIDTANDFHKIGGFMIIQPCLKCTDPKVRAQICNLLAELCQNNPYCQFIILENALMPDLLNLIENDSNNEVVVKALYAVSCLIRDNSQGCAQFIQYCGVQIFAKALKRKEEKCVIKICFLLSALSCSEPDFRNRLVFEDYIPTLVSMIKIEHQPTDEQVLSLLLTLIENNVTAVNECKQNVEFKDILTNYAANIRNVEQYLDEAEYCDRIINILYPRS